MVVNRTIFFGGLLVALIASWLQYACGFPLLSMASLVFNAGCYAWWWRRLRTRRLV